MNKLEEIIESIKLEDIEDVQWKTQLSSFSSILFYNLGTDPEKKQKAKESLENTNYHTLVLSTDTDLGLKDCITVKPGEFQKVQEDILNHFYPLEDKIHLGVTGTNGKTTTVDLIRQLILLSNKKVITVGTLGVYLNDKLVENFGLTTPNYIDLRKTLFKYKNDYDFMAMELSSHALVQKRIGELSFDQIGWTNLTQDHLDYHKTMEEYFNAKMIVFDKLRPAGKLILPYSQHELRSKILRSNVFVEEIKIQSDNPFLQVQYNKDNLEVALNMLKNYLNMEHVNLNLIKAPPGRFNIIEYKDSFIIIDFAHTPDAIESISLELKKSFPKKKLKVLFGCGGDRDKSKRPLMAKASERYANFVYLTSDNPRFEKPEQIIEDAAVGFSGENYCIITDRAEAIGKAIQDLNNDVLLIAGKGHEEYIDQMGVKRDYSDLRTVKEWIYD